MQSPADHSETLSRRENLFKWPEDQTVSKKDETVMGTTNKFQNSYGYQFHVTSPRQTNTTQFGHNMNNINEESQIEIE